MVWNVSPLCLDAMDMVGIMVCPHDVFGSGGIVQDIHDIVHWCCSGRGHGGCSCSGGCGHNN